jgi:16S rRNA (guanine527-N7)-methyltransferase
MKAGVSDSVWHVLHEAHRFGFLGPGPVEHAIAHALGFAELVREFVAAAPSVDWTKGGSTDGAIRRAVDLGSGGGLPGFVLIDRFASVIAWTLVDAQRKRVDFLKRSIDGWFPTAGASVLHGRVEQFANELESQFDCAVARGFGPPASTAECAARLLHIGGVLIVSEPPQSNGERWVGLDRTALGLELEAIRHASADQPGGPFGYAVIRKHRATATGYPRSAAALSSRPLF